MFFIYQLDMIIPKKLTDKYSFFNFTEEVCILTEDRPELVHIKR